MNNDVIRLEGLLDFLKSKGMIDHGEWEISMLAGDGSIRQFFRLVRRNDARTLIAILPASGTNPEEMAKGRAEAASSYAIGTHLQRVGVPVPAILGYDASSRVLLCEDLGDTLLHTFIVGRDKPGSTKAVQSPSAPELESRVAEWYHEAIDILIRMQTQGREGFDTDWCWDTPSYDRQLMLNRESGYFIKSFCQDYLGIEEFPSGLQSEFELLADRAAAQPAGYFLHRDFQSRNLMVHQGQLRVIDFQGGRLGPLGYDLASLLIDPYVALPVHLRDRLLQHYLDRLVNLTTIDVDFFLEGYYCLALQRNLQILGAFAFLSQIRGKTFFHNFITPAALTLHEHLAKISGDDYPCLRALTATCLARLHSLSNAGNH